MCQEWYPFMYYRQTNIPVENVIVSMILNGYIQMVCEPAMTYSDWKVRKYDRHTPPPPSPHLTCHIILLYEIIAGAFPSSTQTHYLPIWRYDGYHVRLNYQTNTSTKNALVY